MAATTTSNGPARRIPVIGIVGGIGSGKSAVARWVAEHANVAVLDADAFGHEALQTESVKAKLCQRFGDAILDEHGQVSRPALAREVFGSDSMHLAARQDLEQIVHPEIEQRIIAGCTQALAAGRAAVLLDAAVLLEAGWRLRCHLVLFVDTPEATRLARVCQTRGWTESELRRRELSQWSLTEKRRESDGIIQNDSTIEAAGQQLLKHLENAGFVPPDRH